MSKIIYSDIDIKLNKDIKTKDIVINTNIDAIRNSIRNILTTRKMERRMLPEFGASLDQLLFEPVGSTTANKIGELILGEIQYWEPRITITNINIIANADQNRYDITIEYSIQSSLINRDSISFTLLT